MDTRSHYIPSFTRINTTAVKHDGAGHLQAICGAWTTPDKHKIDPEELTCWGCKVWMENIGIADQKES